MKTILRVCILICICFEINGQFSLKPQKDSQLTEITLDTNKCAKMFNLTFQYNGIKNIETEIEAKIEFGLVNIKEFKQLRYKVFVKDTTEIVVPIKIDFGFAYKDLIGKSILLTLNAKNSIIPNGITAKTQILFKLKSTQEPEKAKVLDIFRMNIGTNFDYLQTNPFKLFYIDFNIMTPNSLMYKSKNGKETNYGTYGRIFQFQGISQINSSRPPNYSDSLGIYGKPNILKYGKNDTVTITRPILYRSIGDVVRIRNYGAAFGMSTPLVSDIKNNFYLSLGIHFEAIFSYFESDINYTNIYNDTLKISKVNLAKTTIDELPIMKRGTNFNAIFGLSMPISWRFSAFELRLLPAISFLNANIANYQNVGKGFKSNYSIYANLTELKQTGLNIGCEIRGILGYYQPSIFNIFIAKTFNLEKLGDFLKL